MGVGKREDLPPRGKSPLSGKNKKYFSVSHRGAPLLIFVLLVGRHSNRGGGKGRGEGLRDKRRRERKSWKKGREKSRRMEGGGGYIFISSLFPSTRVELAMKQLSPLLLASQSDAIEQREPSNAEGSNEIGYTPPQRPARQLARPPHLRKMQGGRKKEEEEKGGGWWWWKQNKTSAEDRLLGK